jgi:pimeloyl-ACP methyl ester carboxylesterase
MDQSSDLDNQARALLEQWGTPKRRARPRVSRALMEAEEHEIALPSGALAAWRLGVGPAVMLVHGWEDDNALWGPLADRFAAIGRAVVALAQGLQAARAVMIASPIPRTGQRRRHAEREQDAPPEVVERALELRAEGEEARRQEGEAMIAAMNTPALIVHSIDDEQCPMGNAERMRQLWPGSELLLVDGLGHRFVAQDADVIQRVVEFCERY